MGNWRQVQARIRKARAGADAPAKLEQLFLKTRDGMVAFELAKLHEAGQREGEALDWYRKAHERFRRDDWRQKAADAIVRLGGAVPTSPGTASEDGGPAVLTHPPDLGSAPAFPSDRPPAPSLREARGTHEPPPSRHGRRHRSPSLPEAQAADQGDDQLAFAKALGLEARSRQMEGAVEDLPLPGEPGRPASDAATPGAEKRGKRRRGRRGGRRHRKGREVSTAEPVASPSRPGAAAEAAVPSETELAPAVPRRPPAAEEAPSDAGWIGARAEEMRTRAGDPGLASRVARLEMQIRRLLACPPHRLADSGAAPAGPGVVLLSDSDLTTHYYITACATLRIEISRLAHSERGGRGGTRQPQIDLRRRLADHLEVSESQATKYMNQHCVVRWLQLDEGAAKVAHFAIGVLEPALND